MKGLSPLVLLLASPALAQFAIPLHSRDAPDRLGKRSADGDEGFKVVDWDALRRASERVSARYGPDAQRRMRDGALRKRWLGIDSLPPGMKEDAEEADKKAYEAALKGPTTRVIDRDGNTLQEASGGPAAAGPRGAAHRRAVNARRTTKRAPAKTTALRLKDEYQSPADIEFYGLVEFGTPKQTFAIDFDTGSADLWVISSACKKNCRGHERYRAYRSSTYKNLRDEFAISYAVGGVSGIMSQDRVSIGGLAVPKQAFGAVTMLSSDYNGDPIDGIMGLGWPSIATSGKTPFFQNVVRDAKLSLNEQVFSFAFGRGKSKTSSASELYLGGVNKSKYSGSFHWTPVISTGYWMVQADCIRVRGVKVAEDATIIFDTGTSYISGPVDQVNDMFSHVPGSAYVSSEGWFTYPTDVRLNMTLQFGDFIFAIDELDMSVGQLYRGSGQYISSVSGANTGGLWVMGLSALKSYYTAFDVGRARMGFAQKRY